MKPILQLALDFFELPRALKLADEVVNFGVDWIEVGTPLIKSEGLEAVRVFRKKFPKHFIVADMKTMDTGRLEMELAAKAGANLATVMASASRSTIKECIEAGKNYGFYVCVDLLEASNPVESAKIAEELGAYCVGVHIPIDAQMKGEEPFEIIKKVREVVNIKIAAAGGLNSENAPLAVKAGADVIIVGGAITKADNAVEAVKKIRQAIDQLVSIKTELYRKYKSTEIIDAFMKVSTPNISDSMHRGGVLEGIKLVSGYGKKMIGQAVTVRTYPGDWAKPVEAIDIASEGNVIVIDAGGCGPAVWGELATWSAHIRKVGGVVINGAVRDIDEIKKLDFPVFCKLVMPNAGEPKGFGEINVPLKISGNTINPGDWIIGDENGVVVVAQERAHEIANRALDVLEKENRIRKEIKEGSSLAKVTELLKWEKTIG